MQNLSEYKERLDTFLQTDLDPQSIVQLAQQGIYAINVQGNVACFYCNYSASWWEDNVLVEHKQNHPLCPMFDQTTTRLPPYNGSPTEMHNWNKLVQFAAEEFSQIQTNFGSDLSSTSSISSVLSSYQPSSQNATHSITSSELISPPPSTPIHIRANGSHTPLRVLPDYTLSQSENVISSEIIHYPAYPAFKGLWVRQNSFTCWPMVISQTAAILSLAGFFYSQFGDMVSCFSCGGSLKGWSLDSDPWSEHAIWFPTCSYVRLQKGINFINKTCKEYHTRLLISPFSHDVNSTLTNNDAQSNPDDTSTLKEKCSICYKNPLQIALIPCGHLVSCTTCIFSIPICPVCHNAFSSVLRIFHHTSH